MVGYDTRLTAAGEASARQAARRMRRLAPAPEVIVVSPLTRALRTAELMFEGVGSPFHVEPLARERVYLSSDIGRHPSELAAEFPQHTFEHLPDIWWYDAGSRDPLKVQLEPQDEFNERMVKFKAWLAARPEDSIAVVCHWGVIYALTGEEFGNCEVQSYKLDQLLQRRVVLVD